MAGEWREISVGLREQLEGLGIQVHYLLQQGTGYTLNARIPVSSIVPLFTRLKQMGVATGQQPPVQPSDLTLEQIAHRLDCLGLGAWVDVGEVRATGLREDWLPILAALSTPTVPENVAGAARVIGLWLKPFCDESLPYYEMIAEAARRAATHITELEDRLPDHHPADALAAPPAAVEGPAPSEPLLHGLLIECVMRTVRQWLWGEAAAVINGRFFGEHQKAAVERYLINLQDRFRLPSSPDGDYGPAVIAMLEHFQAVVANPAAAAANSGGLRQMTIEELIAAERARRKTHAAADAPQAPAVNTSTWWVELRSAAGTEWCGPYTSKAALTEYFHDWRYQEVEDDSQPIMHEKPEGWRPEGWKPPAPTDTEAVKEPATNMASLPQEPGWFNAAANYPSGYMGEPVWVWREGPCFICGQPITEAQIKPFGYCIIPGRGAAHDVCAIINVPVPPPTGAPPKAGDDHGQ